MAEAALFSLASKVLSMISSPAFEKAYESARSFWGAKGGLEELKGTIKTIQAKLHDAEKKQRYSDAVKNWIDRVRDVLYDAEDLFDEIYTHYMMKQQVKGGKHKKEVWGFFSKLNPIVSRDSIPKKVKGIRKSLSEISSDMALFGLMSCNTEEERWVSGKGRETDCFVDPNDVIGRDDEKQEVLDFLYDESCVDLNISVIYILGMGGMGKSTLAQLVYNDGEIAKDFKYRFWACVSGIWDDRKLIGKIYQSMTGKQYDRLSLDDLQESIREFITGLKGRFILVLDDLWVADRARGIKLWSLLSSDVTKGSKIIMTTRHASAACAYNADRILFLEGLSNDASWKLFKRFAFSEEQEGDPTWISLGQKIVKKCVNAPLAIKTIASLLRIKDTMEEWRSFEDEELLKNALGENPIMNPLRLSYDHLPSHLKNCFAYCSLFPKDSSLDKQDLIYLWIAQGYVKPRLNEYLYDRGNAYFMELLRRSFFQEEPITKPDSLLDNDSEGDSEIRSYKMHDLVHELAQEVSGDETLILTTRAHEIDKRVRHLSGASEMDDTWRIAPALVEVDRLRSLLFFPAVSRGMSRVLDQQVTKLRFLYALDLRRQGIEEVPFSIGKLKYLRYLNLSENHFSHLPDSLTKLVNLLTLDISKCELLEELPENIGELMNLRHLVNSTCDKLWRLPPSLGELTSLEHLSEYKLTISCDGDDASLLAGLDLGGKLKIFLRDSEGGSGEEETLQNMHIPDTIEELVIVWHSGLMRIPTWWREDPAWSMSKLECLELIGSDGVKKLPPLRQLPRLRVLSLSEFRELEYVEEEGGGEEAGYTLFFPSLGKLDLREIPKLRGWFRRVNEEEQPPAVIKFPFLSELRIEHCEELVTMPLAPCLQLLLLAGTTAELVSLLLPTCSWLSSLRLKEIKGLISLMCKGLTSLRKVHLVELKDLRDVSLPPNLVEELTINHCGELNLWENTEEGEIGLNKIPEPEKLPSSLQQLVSLGKLKIKLDYGWHLISHIPEIRLVHQHDQIIHKPNSSLSSKIEGDRPTYPSSKPERIGWDKVEAEGKKEVSSPSPPPPPPRSFHQDSGLFSTRKITRNRGFDSQGAEYNKGLQQKESDVVLEVSEYSEIERESLSKGILFLLGNGYEFEKEKLVQLWMALGSIKEEPMEINGATSFDKLLSEEYLLSSDSNSMYKVNAERVKNDSDMIQNKPKFLVVKSTNQHNIEPDEILHVSVLCDGSNDAIIQTLHKFKKLITLLFHASCGPRIEQLSLDRSLSSESLLALDLSGAEIKELPSFVGQMGQLRYLDLSWTLVEHLPEAVTCLKWLQTLRLRGCSRIQRLPSNMEMLTELRHLDLNILGQLKVMPKGLGRLIKLRTLSAFVVGTQEGYDIKELRDLSNISGDFCIAKLENVRSVDDAKCASMNTKFFFRKLDLRWSDFTLRDLQNEVSSDSVLNNLRPHLDLEELIIRCYAGTSLPNWIADEASFHKLARITLFKCEHVSMLPSIQKLPSMEYLELVSLNSVITVDVRCEIGHVAFPKLQTLIIDEMLGTETWTAAEEVDFPCLIELTISNCPTLSEFPSLLYLTSLKRLEMSSCPQVKFLPGKKLSSSLENLIVDDCPLFVESCREKEWELIKHVPNVWIDQEAIFEETDCSSDVVGEDYDDNDNDNDDDSTEDENGYNHLVD